MIPVIVELINGDLLLTADGYNYNVLVSAPLLNRATLRIKIEGHYVSGPLWYRVNEKWHEVKNLYVKNNTTWALAKKSIGGGV